MPADVAVSGTARCPQPRRLVVAVKRMSARIWLAGLAVLWAPNLVLAGGAPFLWSVQQGTVTHYLQGSVHMLPPGAHPLPQALDRAYAGAVEIVFETDPGVISEPRTQQQLMRAAMVGEGGLKAQLPPPLYERLRQRAQALGMPLLMCEPFKAWFCALSLEIFSYQQAGFLPELGVDGHYYERALEDEKTIFGLESASQHLDLFVAMPAPMGLQLLEQALNTAAGQGPTPQALYRSWREDDTAGMAALLAQMRAQHPQIYERVLAARNRAWLAELQRRFESDTPQLVLVGAAHLVGPDGLVNLLKARGLKLQAVE